MSVTVDDQPLATDSLGLRTVGQVLSHLRSRQRLVVHLMIDGKEPDLEQIESLCAQTLLSKSVFIETVDPAKIATEVLDSVQGLLVDAEVLRAQAVTHLQAGEHADALKKLGTCFSTWNNAQESVEKIARLLGVNLDSIQLENDSLQTWLGQFGQQLSEIRSALEARDYVALSDILAYEAHETCAHWQQAVDAIRSVMR